MTLLKIAQIGAPNLRESAREVSQQELETPDVQKFIDDLVETMRDANGAGLAAPQVYCSLRICAIEVHNNPRYPYKPNIPLTILINPVLSPIGTEQFENYEGCLSVPDLRGKVLRYAQLRVEATDRHGEPINFVTAGLTAGTFQHEVDHLDGKLFLDRVTDTTSLCTWKEFARWHQAGFAAHASEIVKQWGA